MYAFEKASCCISAFVIFLLASLASSLPEESGYPSCPVFPQVDGLDPPVGGTLKAILLAVGYQQYACDNEALQNGPVSEGFVDTTLFDVSRVAQSNPVLFKALATRKVFTSSITQQLTRFGKLLYTPANSLDAMEEWVKQDPVDGSGRVGFVFHGPPVERVDAPVRGPDGEGAIDWAKLEYRPRGPAVPDRLGVKEPVFRLFTVGGLPTRTCDRPKDPWVEKYAAQYWFYDLTGDGSRISRDSGLAQTCRNFPVAFAPVKHKGRKLALARGAVKSAWKRRFHEVV
ncbi:MAG: hypothetical protein M1826_003549 [Phylliscum demangeonii]|nr:MAG: hypothetical protein M1826_003549 [Phylliscum demangeonii]